MNKIKLCTNDNCTGCRACKLVCPKQCIEMLFTDEGFSFPVINSDKCIKCGLCMKSCHQLQFICKKKESIKVLAAWHKDNNVRALSSSGGVFSAIAENIIDKDGNVFGASFFNGLIVKHIAIGTKSELECLRGSKYVQSDIGRCYKEVQDILESDRYVLFIGTPCQVAGLYTFLKKDFEKLFTCDFVCHGVPSQKAFDVWANKIRLLKHKSTQFSFRDTKGWGYQLSFLNKDISVSDAYYLKAFTKGYMFMEACYKCKYSVPQRVSDLTLGDFWGIGEKIPFKYSKNKGISLLLINTPKGEELVKECSATLLFEERTIEEAISGNFNLSHTSPRPQERDTFYMDAIEMNKWKLMRKYKLFPSWRDFLRPLKRKIQSFL